MRTYIDTYMNAQKELVLDNYKKDSKAAYETKKNLFRIYFCSDLILPRLIYMKLICIYMRK